MIYGAEIESIKPVSDRAYGDTVFAPSDCQRHKETVSTKYRVAQAH